MPWRRYAAMFDVPAQPATAAAHDASIDAPVSARLGSFTKAEKFVAREAQLLPVAGKISIHQMVREDVMPGRHRRMRREDGALTDQLAGLRMGRACLNKLANPLQGEEGRMTFVGMPY